MIRRGLRVAARLGHHGALPGGPYILPTFSPASAFGSSMDSLESEFCQEKTDLKNYALPNASWCPDMLNLYHEFLEKTKADGWIRLPSFKSNRNHIQGLKLPLVLTVSSDKSDCHIFTRCIKTEGQGYEYVIFFHPSKKKSVCLFQPGPYLEGPRGFAHGGSLAAMIDETFSKTAYLAGEGLFTLNLNTRFKNLIRMGSLAVLNVGVEKVEDQKLYISCVAQSTDQQTVYAKASGTFLQLQLEEDSSQYYTLCLQESLLPTALPTGTHPRAAGGVREVTVPAEAMGEPVYSDVRGLIRKCDCLALGSLYFSPDPPTLPPFAPPHPPPTPLKQGLVHPVGP
ncbi:acyl-coenzyme A thioesterase THEM5 [Delphinapterus leucas]|uniref:Acyl-coenzyme A thioesterase THEM5 n=1 Tax=Delphinapterus leucas TaxID=9749 RepID=A0A7F8K4W7_DELLE|nr:acyl-coenzyme A thioesterase THEM5 [Delphinapterus leucas]